MWSLFPIRQLHSSIDIILGLILHLIETSTRNFGEGVKRPACKLTALSPSVTRLSRKYESLDVSHLSCLPWPVTEAAAPFPLFIQYIYEN
jgi:hypothetical protein